MSTPVPYDTGAALSALIYKMADSGKSFAGQNLFQVVSALQESLEARRDTLSVQDFEKQYMDLKKLQNAMQINGLGFAKVNDTSWSHPGRYGTMNAATFRLPDGSLYVAYRGTGDGNWQYNAQSAYGNGASYMEKWAEQYFNDAMVANATEGDKVYVTGHSQGGNNAMYVTLFSPYRDRIEACITIDGPGFNEALEAEAKGKEGFQTQLEKIYAVYGNNDFVHGLGENQLTVQDGEHIRFVDADLDSFVDCHDIFSHFDEDGHLKPVSGEGPISALLAELNQSLLDHLSKEERAEAALGMMAIIELAMGSGEWPDGVGGREIITLIADGIPAIIQAVIENPGTLMEALHAAGVDKMIADFVRENPLLAAGIVVLAPAALALAGGIVYLAKLVDTIITIVDTVKEIAKKVGDFIVGTLSAVKNAVGRVLEWLKSNSRGGRYVADNPYFRTDTSTLRELAQRVRAVNRRLIQLDVDMDSLYWQVGLLDMGAVLRANAATGWSVRLTAAAAYLEQAASTLESAENKARGIMTGG